MPILGLKELSTYPDLKILDAGFVAPHFQQALQVHYAPWNEQTIFDWCAASVGGKYTTFASKSLKLMIDAGIINQDLWGIPRLFLTHGHIDHSRDLIYYLSQRTFTLSGHSDVFVPEWYAPKIQALIECYQQIEDCVYDVQLHALKEGQLINLANGCILQPFKATHVIETYGYQISRTTKKIKPEGLALGPQEIVRIKNTSIEAYNALFHIQSEYLLLVSSDTNLNIFKTQFDKLTQCRHVFLECTFWDEVRDPQRVLDWGHLEVKAVFDFFEANKAILPTDFKLVLYHFSARYPKSHIAQQALKTWQNSDLRDQIFLLF